MDLSNMRLYDNTRLGDYKRCPRYYFFRHVQHWVLDGGVSTALTFGGAWHAAMDVLWTGIASGIRDEAQLMQAAYSAFLNYWIDAGALPPDEITMDDARDLGARTPGTAYDMLLAYVEKRRSFISQHEIIAVERPFAVPLSPTDETLFYVGRIDKIIRVDSKSVRGIEHKTTTATKKQGTKTKIRPLYLESYSPNSQVDGYIFALHLLFPDKNIDVWVDAAMVHKLEEDFQFISVDRTPEQVDSWLWNTHNWISKIEEDKRRLAGATSRDRYLEAFAQDTGSCFDFNTACPYLGLCKARANPLTWSEPPNGYKREVWDPLDHIGTPEELK